MRTRQERKAARTARMVAAATENPEVLRRLEARAAEVGVPLEFFLDTTAGAFAVANEQVFALGRTIEAEYLAPLRAKLVRAWARLRRQKRREGRGE